MITRTYWLNALAGLLLLALTSAASADENKFLAAAWDSEFIQNAIASELPFAPDGLTVSGVTVPHHLVVPDLIARGLLSARGSDFNRVILLSPDHFRATQTPFGVTSVALDTVFGQLPDATPIAEALIADGYLTTDLGAAPREHGIHAITPFIAALFPDTEVVAITASARSSRSDWDALVAQLLPLIDGRTLIVQSTDYSHFLPKRFAVRRDQETLNALMDGSLEAILTLDQPAHLDSLAAQYIQTRLQATRGAHPVIIANRNAHEDVGNANTLTTSYVVTAYLNNPEQGHKLRYEDQDIVYFGGDTFLGRGIAQMLTSATAMESTRDHIRAITGDFPLILNLEGTVLSETPVGRNNAQHLMLADNTLPELEKLGVTAVSTANNHAHDFGFDGLARSSRLLEAVGISTLPHGKISDLGPLRVLPITMRRGYFADHPVARTPEQIKPLCQQPAVPPLVAFLHWGNDYDNTLGPTENAALEALAQCGVSAVIGAHSHVASEQVQAKQGLSLPVVVSLGNFLFDQSRPGIGGALAELRVFKQGTIALRLIPIGNLYRNYWVAP